LLWVTHGHHQSSRSTCRTGVEGLRGTVDRGSWGHAGQFRPGGGAPRRDDDSLPYREQAMTYEEAPP
jgi:hypothetical protein